MRAVIVASGPSAAGFQPPDGLPVIAVNGAVSWLSRADYWFSLDASAANQEWLRMALHRGIDCHVAGWKWRLCLAARNARRWERIDSLGTYRAPIPQGSPEWWLWRLGAVLGICKESDRIHTGNSAWGALGLAWHLGFRDVALIGVDGCTGSRVEGGTPGNLSHLPLLFASAAPDMRVTSCGALTGIPRQPFGEWYENS